MTGEEWVLAATVFFSGLASGLLGMLSTIMRPMLTAMDGPGFRKFMGAFLQYADNGLGKVFNLAWALGMFLLPDAMPRDWEAGRRKYFTINWIQLLVTWSSFALFIAALTASDSST